MPLDKCNGLTAKLMTYPRLLEVPRELKNLMHMCFHFPLNLAWFTYIPSRFLLMMTFSTIPTSFSHHLTFGIHPFWTMALLLLILRRSNKRMMILCSMTPCLMNLEIFTKEWYSTWTYSEIQALQRLGNIHFMLIFTRAIQLRKIGSHSGLILDGNLKRLSNTPTRLVPGLEALSLNLIT